MSIIIAIDIADEQNSSPIAFCLSETQIIRFRINWSYAPNSIKLVAIIEYKGDLGNESSSLRSRKTEYPCEKQKGTFITFQNSSRQITRHNSWSSFRQERVILKKIASV